MRTRPGGHPHAAAANLVRQLVEVILFSFWLGWWYALEVTTWQTPDGRSIPAELASSQFWATRAPYWYAGMLMAEECAYAAALVIGITLFLLLWVVPLIGYRALRDRPTQLLRWRRVHHLALRIWAGTLLVALLLSWVYLPFALGGFGSALPVGTPLDFIRTGLPAGWATGDTRFTLVLVLMGTLPTLIVGWTLIRRTKRPRQPLTQTPS